MELTVKEEDVGSGEKQKEMGKKRNRLQFKSDKGKNEWKIMVVVC